MPTVQSIPIAPPAPEKAPAAAKAMGGKKADKSFEDVLSQQKDASDKSQQKNLETGQETGLVSGSPIAEAKAAATSKPTEKDASDKSHRKDLETGPAAGLVPGQAVAVAMAATAAKQTVKGDGHKISAALLNASGAGPTKKSGLGQLSGGKEEPGSTGAAVLTKGPPAKTPSLEDVLKTLGHPAKTAENGKSRSEGDVQKTAASSDNPKFKISNQNQEKVVAGENLKTALAGATENAPAGNDKAQVTSIGMDKAFEMASAVRHGRPTLNEKDGQVKPSAENSGEALSAKGGKGVEAPVAKSLFGKGDSSAIQASAQMAASGQVQKDLAEPHSPAGGKALHAVRDLNGHGETDVASLPGRGANAQGEAPKAAVSVPTIGRVQADGRFLQQVRAAGNGIKKDIQDVKLAATADKSGASAPATGDFSRLIHLQNQPQATPSAGQFPNSSGNVQLPSGQAVSENHILNQVVGQISIGKNHGPSSISIKLHPKELGQIRLDLTVDQTKVKAHLIAQNQQVQDVLERHLPALRSALQQQGLQLDHLQVSVDSRQAGSNMFFQQQQQQQQNSSAFQPRHWTPAAGFSGSSSVSEEVASASARGTGGLSLRI